jgi:putative FmdB family regulatory protein
MPIYEFVCESCGRVEERLQKLTDPPPEACPECGAKMAKIMSRNSFQLKGGGWYKDLYSSHQPKKFEPGGPSATASSAASAVSHAPAQSPPPHASSSDSSPAPSAPAPSPAAKPAASAPAPGGAGGASKT